MTEPGTRPTAGPRVLIVANEFPPTGGGGVIRMAKLAKYLPRHGWRVTVLTREIQASELTDQRLLDELPDDVVIERVARPVRLRNRGDAADESVPPIGPTGAGASWRAALRRVAGTGFRWLARGLFIPEPMIQWALRLIVVPADVFGAPDVVVASAPPRSSLIAGLVVARRTRAPLVLDFRDDWTPNPYFATRLPWRRFIEQRLEAACVRAAGAIVVVSDVSAARYAAIYPEAAARIHVIPNGFDPEDVPPAAGNHRDGPVTLAHVGSMHLKRDPGPFLRALAGVLAERSEGDPALRLRLIGPIGDWQRELVGEVLPAGVASIEPFRPQRAALEEAARSDVLVILTTAAEGADATLPGKLYEYAAVHRPILLVAPEGPAARMISENRLGVWGDIDEPGSVEQAIEASLAMGRDAAFLGASEAFLERYDRRRQSERWSELLGQLLRPGADPT